MISEVDILGDMQETSNADNSDNKYLYVYDRDDELRWVEQSRIAYILEGNGLDQVGYDEDNFVLLKVGDTVNPEFFNTPIVPEDWFDPPNGERKAEPLFSEVDNPCGWGSYYFYPTFTFT